jgi:cell division protein FtsB
MIKRKKSKDFLPSEFFQKIKERTLGKKSKVKRILFLLLFVFVCYRFFSGPYGFIQIRSLWQEKKDIERESKMWQAKIVDLEIEKKRLSEDKFYLEKQARERLGMVKEGEKVYKIVPLKKVPPKAGEQVPPSEGTWPPPDSLSTRMGGHPPR